MPLMIRLEVILGLGTLPSLSVPFYVPIAPFNNTGQNTKAKTQTLKSQKFETQNSKHPYTKHNVPYRFPYCTYLLHFYQCIVLYTYNFVVRCLNNNISTEDG